MFKLFPYRSTEERRLLKHAYILSELNFKRNDFYLLFSVWTANYHILWPHNGYRFPIFKQATYLSAWNFINVRENL